MENYALLITSSQNDLLAPSGKAWGLTNETVLKNGVPGKLKALMERARAVNIPVIHSPVSFDYSKLKDFEPLSSIQSVIIENRLLEDGTPGVEFIEEATPLEKELVLPPRQGFSSFWANTIQSHLNDLGVTTLFIAGMLAEGCVESHSRDAVENGYRPIIISDAIGSTSEALLEASLKTLELHSAKLMTTEQVLNYWKV
jgi:nicotinamidase-related amidase